MLLLPIYFINCNYCLASVTDDLIKMYAKKKYLSKARSLPIQIDIYRRRDLYKIYNTKYYYFNTIYIFKLILIKKKLFNVT